MFLLKKLRLFLFILVVLSTNSFAVTGPINVALQGTASQSSTGWSGVASRAIDGNTDGNYNNGSVTSTAVNTAYQWWIVDLGSVQPISKIDIFNRTDCCSNRLDNTWVMLGDADFNPVATLASFNASKAMAKWRGQITSSSVQNTFNLPSIVYARYILVQKADNNYLSLAEVQAWVASSTRDYTIAKRVNIVGDIKIIGNSVMRDSATHQCAPLGILNTSISAEFVDIDSDSSTINSTSANLSLPNNSKSSDIVWAGLYWQGYYSNYTNNTITTANTVKLKTPTMSSYDSIVADKLNWVFLGNGNRWYYQGMKDITDYVKAGVSGKYIVADVGTSIGKPAGGPYGAWAIVVIYKNPAATLKNITVFDGYAAISLGDSDGINVFKTKDYLLSGFKTPLVGNVNSSLLFFAGEGDIGYTGDYMGLSNKSGTTINLQNALNPVNDIMNSTISEFGSYVTTREPSCQNTIGADIDSFNVGTTGQAIIGNDQTSTKITLSSSGDGYFPAVFALSTDVYRPTLCYDYSATVDGYPPSRKVNPDGSYGNYIVPKDGQLRSKIFIRGLEGDFDFANTKMSVGWSDVTNPTSGNFAFTSVLVKNPSSNAYTSTTGVSGVGTTTGTFDIGDPPNSKIPPYSSAYALADFAVSDATGDEIAPEISVETQIYYDNSNPSQFSYSTADGTLQKCPGTLTYNPQWYKFNIENSVVDPKFPYALNTQVTNTPMSFNVVSYDASDPNKLGIKKNYSGSLEVEMIELSSMGSFDNANMSNPKFSFDRICEDPDPSMVKIWGKTGNRKFSLFNGNSAVKLSIDAKDNKYAIRNGAFRMWILEADKDGDGVKEILTNTCQNTSGNCFRPFYANLKSDEANKPNKIFTQCDTQCASSSNDERCYTCLRENYAKPICSRDNFAIRPYGVELSAKSMGTLIQKNSTKQTIANNLLSGYKDDYTISYEAKNQNLTTPEGYFFAQYATDPKSVKQKDMSSVYSFFGLVMDNSKINSKNESQCKDSDNKRFDFDTTWSLDNDNVGNYDIELFDKDWTLVDQNRYPYKPQASKGRDDCKQNDAALSSDGLSGCDVQSFDVGSDPNFNKIPVKFVPARVNIQSLGYDSFPQHTAKWAYMNNLSANSDMAARFTGSIVAQNAKGDITTNFTSECFAQPTEIQNQYSTTQLDSKGDVVGVSNGAGLVNLRYIERHNGILGTESTGTISQTTKEEEKTDGVTNDYLEAHKILKEHFLDVNLGGLLYDLRYTINKLFSTPINPVEILFVKLKSTLYDTDEVNPTKVWKLGYAPNTDPSKINVNGGPVKDATFEIVDIKNIFERDANVSIAADIATKSFKFIYGRVFTPQEISTQTSVVGRIKNVSLSTLMYLSDAALLPRYQSILGNNPSVPTANWYVVQNHSQNNTDGQIDTINAADTSVVTIRGSKIAKDTVFNNPNSGGSTQTIAVQYSGNIAPYTAVVTVNPTVWLKHNNAMNIANGIIDGNPRFNVVFRQVAFDWAGEGQTGNVINQAPTSNANNRLNW